MNGVPEERDQIKTGKSAKQEGKKVFEDRETGHDDQESKRVDRNRSKCHDEHGPEWCLSEQADQLGHQFVFENPIEIFKVDDVFEKSVVDCFADQDAGHADQGDEKRIVESAEKDNGRIVRDDVDEEVAGNRVQKENPEVLAAPEGSRAEVNDEQGSNKNDFADKD